MGEFKEPANINISSAVFDVFGIKGHERLSPENIKDLYDCRTKPIVKDLVNGVEKGMEKFVFFPTGDRGKNLVSFFLEKYGGDVLVDVCKNGSSELFKEFVSLAYGFCVNQAEFFDVVREKIRFDRIFIEGKVDGFRALFLVLNHSFDSIGEVSEKTIFDICKEGNYRMVEMYLSDITDGRNFENNILVDRDIVCDGEVYGTSNIAMLASCNPDKFNRFTEMDPDGVMISLFSDESFIMLKYWDERSINNFFRYILPFFHYESRNNHLVMPDEHVQNIEHIIMYGKSEVIAVIDDTIVENLSRNTLPAFLFFARTDGVVALKMILSANLFEMSSLELLQIARFAHFESVGMYNSFVPQIKEKFSKNDMIRFFRFDIVGEGVEFLNNLTNEKKDFVSKLTVSDIIGICVSFNPSNLDQAQMVDINSVNDILLNLCDRHKLTSAGCIPPMPPPVFKK